MIRPFEARCLYNFHSYFILRVDRADRVGRVKVSMTCNAMIVIALHTIPQNRRTIERSDIVPSSVNKLRYHSHIRMTVVSGFSRVAVLGQILPAVGIDHGVNLSGCHIQRMPMPDHILT